MALLPALMVAAAAVCRSTAPRAVDASTSTIGRPYTLSVHTAPGQPFGFVYGVDHGPACDGGVSVASELREMGASVIRTHDSGVLDWPVVYPHPQFDAPTNDPASYSWDAADEYYGNIVDAGFTPYLRLGTSWGQLGGGLPPAGVDYNRTALVDVLLHTAMHFRDGWGGGRNFSGLPFKYVEIWNEPDSAVEGSPVGRFWNRSAADFYDLVHDTAVALKAWDPELIVAADGVATAMNPASAPYSWGLITELAKRGTPFDAFSWHTYDDQPAMFAATALAVRAHLDAAGLEHVAQHVTEWFPCILCPEQDSATGAAAFGATLSTLVNSGVSLATLYPLCSWDEGGKTGGHGWGLFDPQTTPGIARWRPLTHVFAGFGDLMQQTPRRLAAVGAPATDLAFTALAGTSASVSTELRGAASAVDVRALVSAAAASNCSSVELTFTGLDGSATASQLEFTVTVVNSSGVDIVALAGNARPTATGNLVLTFPLVPPAVAMVRVASPEARDEA